MRENFARFRRCFFKLAFKTVRLYDVMLAPKFKVMHVTNFVPMFLFLSLISYALGMRSACGLGLISYW